MVNKNDFRLIGLVGYARVGKDTVAGILCRKYDYSRYGFADPIRNMIYSLTDDLVKIGICIDDRKEFPVLGYNNKGEAISYRFLAKALGTEWARNTIDPSFWIKIADIHYQWKREHCEYAGLVISDVRFENEAEWIVKNRGELWVIERNVEQVRDHVSEQYEKWIYNYDYHLITNNSSFEELEAEVEVAYDWRF